MDGHDVDDVTDDSQFLWLNAHPIIKDKIQNDFFYGWPVNTPMGGRWWLAFLKKISDYVDIAWTDEKQSAIDLLMTQYAGKIGIIDNTDYVLLGYRVDEVGNIIEPDE